MFTTRDPIGLMGGDNVFQYAPNPTGWIDPLGLHGEVIVDTSSIEKLWDLTRAAPLIMAAAIGTQVLPKDKVKTDDKPCTSNDPCPPCITATGRIVVVGTIGYRDLDIIPDDEMQHGRFGSHHNIFVAKQAPRGTPKPCKCQWSKQKYVLKPDELKPTMVPVEPFVYKGIP